MKRAIVVPLVFVFAGCASQPRPAPVETLSSDLEQGDAKLAAADFAAAIDAYSRAIGIDASSALAWFRRGEAKSGAGDPAGASADFTEAIRLNAAESLPWFHRGQAKQAQGDYAGAIDDFAHALRIRTTGAYFRGRGHARFCDGDLEGALADLEEATVQQPDGVALDYTELELAALRIREGHRADAAARLSRHFRDSRRSAESAWPRQIAAFLEGEVAEAEFLLTAKSGEEKRTRTCEACFYAAMSRAADGDEDRAITLFRECLDNAVPGFVEPDMARAELKRLER